MDSSSFSEIIIGGIQDVSALLPLLGTEQCETHVGSALDKGFLYGSVAPISIFGSLGIVRAAFNILIASVDIQQYRFLGAKKLSNSGFDASGFVAPIIALDPHHPKRFLVESRLETMLTDEHIENVEDLTVSWGKGIAWWNFLLAVFTLFIAAAGLLPYVLIVHDSQHNTIRPLFPFGLGFPTLRVVGSVLCVNVAQFLIQIRILVLLKTRLLFITIDRLAKEADIDMAFEINSKIQRKGGEKRKSMWSFEQASEKCIWALEKWLACESQTARATPEKDSTILAAINKIYISQHKRQLESLHKAIPRWITPFLCVGLAAGILLTVAGYIGCFYLIQHSSDNSIGPLLWLILEALLSIIRTLVWAVNPSWDDSEGIVFELQLASHAPLITCNKYESDITNDGIAPVTRANSFLKEVVAYTGPLPPFNVDDVELYYILTAEGKGPPQSVDTLPHGKLYVVISDYKEKTSRILFKQDAQSTFSIYISALEPVHGSTAINVRAKLTEEGATEPKTHFLTADASFMNKLMGHYNKIISQLQEQKLNFERKVFFGKTWALQPRLVGGVSEDVATLGSGHRSEGNWDLLTNEDIAYLRQGQVESRWREIYSHLEEWIELYIAVYTKELLEDVPVDLVFKENESVNIVQKYEANEVEYLLIECRTCLEQLLLSTTAKWNEFMEMDHKNMVNAVIQGTFLNDAASPKEFPGSSNFKRHGGDIRKKKLESRLADEWHGLLEKETRSHRQNMRSRLMAQADSTEQRIQKRKYNDPTGETIVKVWRSLEGAIHSAAADESNHAPRNTIAARRDAFIAKMETRFLEGDEDVSNLTDADGINSKHKCKLMEARCRQRIDRLFSRMEVQMTEFKELHSNDILTADFHELVEYWRIESLQERRRLLDRTQKCLAISDASIQAVGGRQNMARALMRSQDFSFIDTNEATLFTAEELVAIVKGLKSVAGVASSLGVEADKEILEAVRTNQNCAVAAKQDACFYGNAVVTDYFRKGYPYLLFVEPGGLSCTVFFHIHKKCDHILTLRHCTTTSSAKLAISLNKHPLEGTWGQSQAVKFAFANEDIHLPEAYLMDVGQPNTLTIVLAEDSEAGYWLSDVFLPAQPLSSTVTTL